MLLDEAEEESLEVESGVEDEALPVVLVAAPTEAVTVELAAPDDVDVGAVETDVGGVLDEPPQAANSKTGASINEYASRRIIVPSSGHVVVRSYDERQCRRRSGSISRVSAWQITNGVARLGVQRATPPDFDADRHQPIDVPDCPVPE